MDRPSPAHRRTPPPPRGSGVVAVGCAALLALVPAACGTDDRAPSSPTPTTATSPAPDASATGTPAPAPVPRPTGTPTGPVRDVATGLDVPWSVVVLPDGGALVSLRDRAALVRVPAGGGTPVPVVAPGPRGTVPDVLTGGEGGLLGLALDPAEDPAHDPATTPDAARSLFVYSTARDGNRVTRWTLDGDAVTDPVVVLSGIPRAGNHNGGRIAFGLDGMLHVATGDAGDGRLSQDLSSTAGKVLRVTRDGEPAPGNPYPGSPVWSWGHRNVQGLGWATDGTMLAAEFGQNRLDELNVITPGANYGWPHAEGTLGGDGFTDPVATWTTAEASPSGLLVTGDAVYLAGLRGERLWRVPWGPDGPGTPQAFLVGELGRLRDVVVAPGGDALWVLTNNTARGSTRPGDDRLVEVPLR